MMIKLAATLGLLLVALLAVSCQDTEHESTNQAIEEPLQVVEFKVNETDVSVPLYENVAPATQRRREFDQQVVGQIMDVVDKLVKDIAISNRNVMFYGVKALGSLGKLLWKKKSEFRALKGADAQPKIKDGYTKHMAGLMRSIIQSNKKGPRVLTEKEVYARTRVLVEAVKAVPKNSPSGLYVDWTQMKIDGVRLDEYSYPIIEWFNKSAGRRLCLTSAGQVIGIVENLAL